MQDCAPVSPSARPLMLLDAASLYFRAFYGVPESITAPDGTPVNAMRGFTDMVARLVTERRPTRLVACLDLDWRPAFRVDALPSYKAHRVAGASRRPRPAGVPEEVPDTLAPQVPVILEVLAAAGIATAGAEGYEADDVIGTLRGRADRPGVAVSGDRDLMQIVARRAGRCGCSTSGAGWPRPSCSGRPRSPRSTACRRRGPGEAYAEMAMLRGDPSDGLPGVPGVGAKTAATLVGRFGSWAELRAAVRTAATPGWPRRCAPSWPPAAPTWRWWSRWCGWRWTRPVRLDRPDRLPAGPGDPDRLAALAERWALSGSVDRLVAALAKAGS